MMKVMFATSSVTLCTIVTYFPDLSTAMDLTPEP